MHLAPQLSVVIVQIDEQVGHSLHQESEEPLLEAVGEIQCWTSVVEVIHDVVPLRGLFVERQRVVDNQTEGGIDVFFQLV